ncbi:NADP-reducing hydrogenase subunit HndA [bacterium HR29]|jgi:NADH:ubiquinone oxidoreductase subunit E|nr:NADP-reducing hydrogenase subunit HndA [bacterium HR29]
MAAAEPSLEELRQLVSEFRPNRGHLLPALHKVQDTYGYIPRSAIEVIARQLNTTPALVYGAMTFYAEFRTHPPAQTEIAWCSGPTCRILGGDRIREALEHTLGLPLGGYSEDGRYALHLGQCNGTCSEAPQVWVNGRVVGRLTVADAIRLARRIREGA